MTAVLPLLSRAFEARVQYAYFDTARQHVIALGWASAALPVCECFHLIADIPMLRDAFEQAVLDMRRNQLRRIGSRCCC
ncbi:hypothetical protein G3N57_00280 [Paraburkholderia sp. Se-20369]|nr:hypothetical protein [Paraburkholderia sp. Se-20369]